MQSGSTAIPAPEADLAGVVDLDALVSWMDDQALTGDAPSGFHWLGGGTQNVMVAFTRGGRRFVLRRGPRHLRATTNDNLRREMRVLAALAGTRVPHPHLIACCSDESVLYGSVFYLMEPVDGFNAAATLPALHASDAAVRHQMGLAIVDALAELGAVDYRDVGLADFGRPDGFLERQVPRWLRELQSYNSLPGYGGPQLPGIARITDWLQANRPASWRPGIMHGDFHLANIMFSFESSAVTAVVDWEMSTIGDPLLDLGWLLATWPQPGEHTDIGDSALANAGGLASVGELVARYAERSNRDVSDVLWYTVLACFKLGVILEGTHARACASREPVDVGDRLHQATIHLFERALALTSGTQNL